MVFDAGTSTGGQISAVADRIKAIEFHARSNNVNSVVVGRSDVTSANGRELVPGEAVAFNFGLVSKEGSVSFNVFYAIVQGDDKVDWTVIKE